MNALSPFHDHFILGFSLGVKLPKHGCNQVDEAPADCDNIIDFAVPAKLDAFCSAVACKYSRTGVSCFSVAILCSSAHAISNLST